MRKDQNPHNNQMSLDFESMGNKAICSSVIESTKSSIVSNVVYLNIKKKSYESELNRRIIDSIQHIV